VQVSLHIPRISSKDADGHLGMGGLACALALAKEGFTNIDVYETASNLGFVGAGIQLAPNMARILDRLGCWADIEKDAVDLLETSIRRRLKFLSVLGIH
jgi:2-polyprenyl-6-methoxyphenol hydroxylase-like FAD-dependent oxidoreductase